LFNITIVFALAYFVLYPGLGNVPGLFGWTQIGRYDAEVGQVHATQEAVYARYRDADPAKLMSDGSAIAIGGRLFANNCAMCHGSDGRGAAGFPNLADADWLYGSDYAQVLASINLGRSGVMPPLGAALGEAGVRDVTQYVLSLSGQASDPGQAAAGKAQFDLFCAACHGPDGKGNQMLGAPNLADETWLYGGTPEVIAQTINGGRNGKMPAHKDLLNDDRQRLLAAYVLSLSAPKAK
jgi:cytochrome c oxidase cbb3-type subunit 3